jgi:hypothetical protein
VEVVVVVSEEAESAILAQRPTLWASGRQPPLRPVLAL